MNKSDEWGCERREEIVVKCEGEKEMRVVTYCKWRCQWCLGARELGPRICPALSAFQPHPKYSKIRSVQLYYDVTYYNIL